MAALIYRIALWLAFPLIWLYLLKRARKQPAYRQNWSERLGYYSVDQFGEGLGGNTQPIWLHAVSVGEMRAAQPIVLALHQQYPDTPLLLTCMTPTGRTTAHELFGKSSGINATIVFLPYDYPSAIRRFLRTFQPRLGLVIDTEIWPNCIMQCQQANVPLVLANARLSQKSLNGYLKFAPLFRQVMPQFAAVLAQSPQDADRLQQLGAKDVHIMGNVKFDNQLDPLLIERGQAWKKVLARKIILLASSRDGEEALVLNALGDLSADTLLIIVPRHPQRFDAVATLLESRGLTYLRRSQWQGEASNVQVLLGDSMGEMVAWYSAADVTIMGGSLLKFGSQNLIEAAACGCPVLIGPSTFNFAQASAEAIAVGAAWQGEDADSVCSEALRVLHDDARCQQMGLAGVAFSQAHRGATARLLDRLKIWLD
ncbi:lipid IV(A) 3-deoxy-D-manno-octulosonic acid transferase [Chitinibacter bivalviorum]|uniref:3-deoxy-D-manno-octulosonic acid transferase n=1 Tax=Chitinibacter bivalviorum TaxID=2739434 RepID=A0A7H9BJN8_9NEIS|nr:lipid IV(A) 3-deoxy-D-manno-octulosonic acid transferase [Chitinibacter bivalviorum]QLG88880.1 lipid IV(A) 3-deoxy-D-manno-octulosonic acid transferase [Chitinibacter bivalviorum]